MLSAACTFALAASSTAEGVDSRKERLVHTYISSTVWTQYEETVTACQSPNKQVRVGVVERVRVSELVSECLSPWCAESKWDLVWLSELK